MHHYKQQTEVGIYVCKSQWEICRNKTANKIHYRVFLFRLNGFVLFCFIRLFILFTS